jgi:membrane dipeptidase
MLIVDGHLDLAWNALQWNRDLLQSVATLRMWDTNTLGPERNQNTVALPEMRRGRVALSFVTLLARSTGAAFLHVDYPSPLQAYAIARGQLSYYHVLERCTQARIIGNKADLNDHMAQWANWEADTEATEPPLLGFVISMEGADPITHPSQLQEWWEGGLRILGLAHYGRGRYAGGTDDETGLSDLGMALLTEMERVGVILDITHCSDLSFWQALEQYGGPVIASHNNCRALVPHQRQFSDEQLRALAERDAVIGVALDVWMLYPNWSPTISNPVDITLEQVADQIDYMCQVFGHVRHVAIGSDLDGGFGRERSPYDIDTIADLQQLHGILSRRGYTEAHIADIFYGNWLRLLRRIWR